MVGVVQDGVFDFVTKDRFVDAGRLLFVIELGGMHANDNDDAGIAGFDLGEIGQRVDAVNAAQGPEVEQHDAAAKIGELDRLVGVEPIGAALQVGGGRTLLRDGSVDRRLPGRRGFRGGVQQRVHDEGNHQRRAADQSD